MGDKGGESGILPSTPPPITVLLLLLLLFTAVGESIISLEWKMIIKDGTQSKSNKI